LAVWSRLDDHVLDRHGRARATACDLLLFRLRGVPVAFWGARSAKRVDLDAAFRRRNANVERSVGLFALHQVGPGARDEHDDERSHETRGRLHRIGTMRLLNF